LLCDSSTWKFKDGSTSTGQGITSWLWDFGDGQSSSERNPRHRYEQEGSYKITLTVKDKNGSSASTNNEIWVTGALYLKINPPARTQSCHAIQLSGYANHGFSWTFPNGIKDTSFEITATQSGWYKAEAQNIACLNRDSIRLTISSDPQNVELIVSDFSGKEINSDLIGFPPVKVKGSLASGSDACHGNWYLNGLPIGDSLTQIFNIEKAGFYRMEWKGINSDSCQRIGIKEFNILEPSIPNLVTANVDGHNDSFKIEGTIINELSIFNRWGKEIFNVKPYQNDWPPSDLQDGTYFYRLKAGETIYQGWVEVVR